MISAGFFLALLAVSAAYKTGPPISDHSGLCQHMIPGHGADPQTGNSPVTLTFHQDCFGPAQTIRVDVATSKDPIEGYFVQARVDSFINASSSYGEFRTYTKHSGQYNCFSGKKNAIGHKGDEPKVKTMKLYWQAPASGLIKDIHIGGTFVIHKKEFWVNVAKKLTYKADCAAKPNGEDEDKKANTASNVKMASGMLLLSILAILKSQ